MLTVTTRADRGIHNSRGQSFSMNAGLKFVQSPSMAESARVRNGLMECGILGGFRAVGHVVAGIAGRSGGIASGDLFAMDRTLMVANLGGVARTAVRLRQFLRVRIIGVFGMALRAGHRLVRRYHDNFLLFVMTTETVHRCGLRG